MTLVRSRHEYEVCLQGLPLWNPLAMNLLGRRWLSSFFRVLLDAAFYVAGLAVALSVVVAVVRELSPFGHSWEVWDGLLVNFVDVMSKRWGQDSRRP
jgi:hypothetical protein